MKKIIIIIFIVIIVFIMLFGLSRIYNLVILNKAYNANRNFRNEKNRCYSYVEKNNGIINRQQKMQMKQNYMKSTILDENENIYFEWRNLQTNEQYTIYPSENKAYKYDNLLTKEKSPLPNVPYSIISLYTNQKININKLFNVYYIIKTKYKNVNCYKIVTKTETIIIDKNTYLPLYRSVKTLNESSNDEFKIEYTYNFEVGNVTDEDVSLPDLTNYEVIE